MINTKIQTCRECGIPIRGRADKKFCSDACRSSHYNNINARSRECIRHVHYVLRKNHKILDEFREEGEQFISAEKLKIRGFDFNYCTSFRRAKDGDVHYYCYDFGFRLDDQGERVFLLIEEF